MWVNLLRNDFQKRVNLLAKVIKRELRIWGKGQGDWVGEVSFVQKVFSPDSCGERTTQLLSKFDLIPSKDEIKAASDFNKRERGKTSN